MKKKSQKLIINGIIVPDEMFTKRFAKCDLAKCKHACCQNGCIMGEIRIAKIKKALPELYTMMRPEAVEVAKKRGFHMDSAYDRDDMDPTHKHYNLRIVKGRCIFLNYFDNGGCVLQRYCRKHNMSYQFKPEGCWSFPFDLIGNRITFYKWKVLPCLDESKNKKSPHVYISCKEEVEDILGKKGYKELLRVAAQQKQG